MTDEEFVYKHLTCNSWVWEEAVLHDIKIDNKGLRKNSKLLKELNAFVSAHKRVQKLLDKHGYDAG